uniref:Uncharacterized protein n=1 Tax=Lactuca sativa TaxID=4236 RepID=A0A9R1WA03_LACSA|nr:hypothetical protein LSAT_V11C300151870 [Lactuca sativa]
MLYKFSSGLEVLSPLCPQLFLEMDGLENFAKSWLLQGQQDWQFILHLRKRGISVTYTQKDRRNVLRLGAGIQLVSTVCSSMHGKVQSFIS